MAEPTHTPPPPHSHHPGQDAALLEATGTTGIAVSGALERIGRYRWTICALLFFATTINYVDRQVLGILAPVLKREIGWTDAQSGIIFGAFTTAYALGYIFAGRLMDRIGVKKGFAIAIVTWSIAAMSHALARTATAFAAARFALGLGESGNFPASIKTVAEWFPARERALATGIFNAGSNVGAIVAPLVVPFIARTWGWRWAFVWTGLLSSTWLAVWLWVYHSPREHPRLGRAELAHIESDAAEAPVPVRWASLLRHRQTWAFAVAKFMTDPIWWFYLFWLPSFLDQRFGIHLAGVAAPLVTIYLMADIGSVGGGWLSGALVKRGWSLNRARKITLLIAALLIVPTMLAPEMHAMWAAVLIVGVAAAAHQWWSANVFTLSSDMFPRYAVGSVVGIGGFFGAIGGTLFQLLTGYVLQANGHNYQPIFVLCGLAYVSALLIVHLLAPRLQRIELAASVPARAPAA
ncbi:MAG TPA: MFS transporter [Gemmatimonadaceae bacterium]|nr:MFS transporter [Gemmatimonadaceae bacterium]